MSTTTLLLVYPDTDKEPKELQYFKNSWGSAPAIWGALYDKYVPKDHPYQSFMTDDRIWSLYNDARLEECERKILTATFDNWYVRAEDAHDFHVAMMCFLKLHKPEPDRVNHLQKIAEAVLSAADNDPEDAFGVWWTSVAERPFQGPWEENEENDEDFGHYAKFDWANKATDWGEYWRQPDEPKP